MSNFNTLYIFAKGYTQLANGDQHLTKNNSDLSDLQPLIDNIIEHYKKGEIREATQTLFSISSVGNGFIQKHKPWTFTKLLSQLKKEEEPNGKEEFESCLQKLELILLLGINIIYLLTALMEPLMPNTALTTSISLGLNYVPKIKDITIFQLWLNNHRIENKPIILFTPVRDD